MIVRARRIHVARTSYTSLLLPYILSCHRTRVPPNLVVVVSFSVSAAHGLRVAAATADFDVFFFLVLEARSVRDRRVSSADRNHPRVASVTFAKVCAALRWRRLVGARAYKAPSVREEGIAHLFATATSLQLTR